MCGETHYAACGFFLKHTSKPFHSRLSVELSIDPHGVINVWLLIYKIAGVPERIFYTTPSKSIMKTTILP